MLFELLDQQIVVSSPGPGVGVMGGIFAASLDGRHLVRLTSLITRSDTADAAALERSQDGGLSWSAPELWPCQFEAANGAGRRHPRGGYVDPITGRYITFYTQGVLPTDSPLEGMRHWTVHYTVSEDHGRTQLIDEQLIHAGEQYDAIHHMPGVTVGRNCVMIGDRGQVPLTRSDGAILMPLQSSPVGSDGHYYNPGKGFTYTDCLVAIGTWQADRRLAWQTSTRICGDPTRTTRGLIEPTIAELAGGRLLMVMRGSNAGQPDMPGVRWFCCSDDGGVSWNKPSPWTFTDGQVFFSPSACSQLVPHSSGRLFWIGNISDQNPNGNSPRYPIIIAEVERTSGLLKQQTITAFDDRRATDSKHLTLSNFYAREDAATDNILVYLPRLFADDQRRPGQKADFTAGLTQYVIGIN